MTGYTAKSLILDLLSSVRSTGADAGLPVAALVAAGQLFGLEENATRVALTRLVAAELVVRDEQRGRYRLASRSQAVATRVGSFRCLEERTVPWLGAWVGVHRFQPPPRGRAQRDDARALRLLGMRPLTDALWVRPDNLLGGVQGVRAQLVELGASPGAFVAQMSELDAVTDRRARGLWDVRALVAGYTRARRTLERSAGRLKRWPFSRALVESFTLGGQVLRQLAHDPLLPEPMVDVKRRQALVAALVEYDALGRTLWGRFLQEYGVQDVRGPLDARIAQEPELRARRGVGGGRDRAVE